MNNTKKILIALIVVVLILSGLLVYSYFDKKSYNRNDFEDRGKNNERILNKGREKSPSAGIPRGNNRDDISNSNCLSDQCLLLDDLEFPIGELNADAKDALNRALDDEYKAYASYDALIKKLGNIRPFIMIVRAEEQHISSLKSLFDKYGLSIPENTYINKVAVGNTLQEACTVGVTAEKANVALYENDLLPKVVSYEDITIVFTNLRDASQNNHLPAFERCAN